MAPRALKTLGALQSLAIFGALFALLVRGGQTNWPGLLEDLSPLRSAIQAIVPVDRFPEAGVPLADGARIVLEPETPAISLGAQDAAGGAPGPSPNGGIAGGGGADANEPPAPPEPDDPGAHNGDDHPGRARGHGAEHPGNGKALGQARNGGDDPDRHASGHGNDHGPHGHRGGRAHGHDGDEERRSSSEQRGRAKGHDRRT